MSEFLRIPEHDPLVCGLDAWTGCEECLNAMAWHRMTDGKAGEDGYLKLQADRAKRDQWQKRKK